MLFYNPAYLKMFIIQYLRLDLIIDVFSNLWFYVLCSS